MGEKGELAEEASGWGTNPTLREPNTRSLSNSHSLGKALEALLGAARTQAPPPRLLLGR